ncbi:acyltransferase family protein [Antribacter gilvus]|uniref:acyltransferase family protein n=1 Tax=Antribacter gilvus TaxID=2304675 RepID=UPI000F79C2DB|nr:acyltransferase family protein [Antribacter gilvus]
MQSQHDDTIGTAAGSRDDPGPARPGPARQETEHTGARRATPRDPSRVRGLDGLRAIAVLAVVVFHLAPLWLPGGFLGVDLFFVVSGFLITTLLLREVARRRRIDLPRFWLRRARRLLPALILVVLVSVPVARLAEPDLTVGIGRQVLGALTFSTNWLEIGAGTDYFDETSPELLRPLWSLAIEEQFYLLWPLALVLLLVAVRSTAVRARVVAGLAAASALLMALLVVPGADPTRVYYGTDTHAFGLLLGAALAFHLARRRPGERPGGLLTGRVALYAPPLALVALGFLFTALRADSVLTYRGGLVTASLLGALLVAVCAGPATPFVRALEVRPLEWVGERSYGIYLWHWPVIRVVDAMVGAQLGTARWWLGAVVALAVTFGLSALSYRFVEMPVRTLGFRGAWRAFAERVAALLGSARVPDAVGLAPRVALAAVVLAVVGTGTAVATAPERTAAEDAVAQGLAGLRTPAGVAGDAGEGEGRPADPTSDPAALPPSDEGSTAGEGPITRRAVRAADPSSDPGGDLSAFGDSVLSAAVPALLNRYPEAAIDAVPNRTWADAPALVEAAAADGTLRDRVILAFGTNAGFQRDGSVDAAKAALDRIGPDRQVVLVNVVGISYWVPDANAQLAALAEGRPNVAVADWNALTREVPGLLHSDSTHPNMEGIAAYTDLVERTFRNLSMR